MTEHCQTPCSQVMLVHVLPTYNTGVVREFLRPNQVYIVIAKTQLLLVLIALYVTGVRQGLPGFPLAWQTAAAGTQPCAVHERGFRGMYTHT